MVTEIFDILSENLKADVYIDENRIEILTLNDRITVLYVETAWAPWLFHSHLHNQGYFFPGAQEFFEYLKNPENIYQVKKHGE
jgi:hypothetical protein